MQLPQGALLQRGKFQIEKVISQDEYSIHYLARTEDNEQVIVKQFYWRSFGLSKHNSRLEAYALYKKFKIGASTYRIEQRNLEKIEAYFIESDAVFYVVKDSLSNNLTKILAKKGGKLDEKEAICIIQQIASAVIALHKYKTNHLNISTDTIYIDKEGQAVLGGFDPLLLNNGNYSPIFDNRKEGLSYAPEEMLRELGASEFQPQSDIYMLGVVLYELVVGEKPVSTVARKEGTRLIIPAGLSASVSKALQSALGFAPCDRPSSVEDWLKELNVCPINPDPFHGTVETMMYSAIKNPELKEPLYLKAASLGNAQAQYESALIYEKGGKPGKALDMYSKAAKQGVEEAKVYMRKKSKRTMRNSIISIIFVLSIIIIIFGAVVYHDCPFDRMGVVDENEQYTQSSSNSELDRLIADFESASNSLSSSHNKWVNVTAMYGRSTEGDLLRDEVGRKMGVYDKAGKACAKYFRAHGDSKAAADIEASIEARWQEYTQAYNFYNSIH